MSRKTVEDFSENEIENAGLTGRIKSKKER